MSAVYQDLSSLCEYNGEVQCVIPALQELRDKTTGEPKTLTWMKHLSWPRNCSRYFHLNFVCIAQLIIIPQFFSLFSTLLPVIQPSSSDLTTLLTSHILSSLKPVLDPSNGPLTPLIASVLFRYQPIPFQHCGQCEFSEMQI